VFSFAAAPVAQTTRTASISGVVLSTDSPSAPVRLARVTLNSVDRGGAAQTVTTDAGGRFTFRRLPPGRYALQSSKRAWLDANYGESRLGRPGTPVAVRDGEQLTGLTMHMTRGAVLTGVVRDAAGEPQPGVTVRVLRYVTQNGFRTLDRPLSINPNDPTTEDDGVYRVYGLPPGDYVVVAGFRLTSDSNGLGGDEIRQIGPNDVERLLAPGAAIRFSPELTGPSERAAGRPMTAAPVYFPGTTDLSAAATITLGPGEERSGVDIAYAMLPAARVTGTLTKSPAMSAQPADRDIRAECRLTPEGFEDVLLRPIAAQVLRLGPDLKLLFPGVPPGRFTIVCASGNQPVMLGWAETSITVNGQDQDIAMSFGAVAELKGRVVFESATPPTDPKTAARIVIRGFGKARLLRPDFSALPEADGAFTFSAVVPGRWSATGIAVPGTPWTLQSVTYGGRELESFIDVNAGDTLADLVVTFTDRPSELTGSLQDVAGRPAAEFFVVAFSTDRTAWTPVTRRIQSTRPASDGVFSIKGLPAGEYFLAALTDVEPGEWLSPAFLDQIVAGAVRVKVVDREKTTQSLRIAR
jgi:hypothetical protein